MIYIFSPSENWRRPDNMMTPLCFKDRQTVRHCYHIMPQNMCYSEFKGASKATVQFLQLLYLWKSKHEGQGHILGKWSHWLVCTIWPNTSSLKNIVVNISVNADYDDDNDNIKSILTYLFWQEGSKEHECSQPQQANILKSEWTDGQTDDGKRSLSATCLCKHIKKEWNVATIKPMG